MKQVPEESFNEYKEWVYKYLKYFGIDSYWTIRVLFKDTEGARAGIAIDFDGRQVDFKYNTSLPDDCPVDPKMSAFHEVMELILCDITHLIFHSKITKEMSMVLEDQMAHRVITLFENKIYPVLNV